MPRKTRNIVYVDKAIMDKPDALTDAVFAHFVKMGVNVKKRKQFLAQVIKKAYSPEEQLKVINEWVQVRDVATFPYRKQEEEEKSLHMSVSGEALSGNTTFRIKEGVKDENTGVEGDVSVDKDGAQESGAAPE